MRKRTADIVYFGGVAIVACVALFAIPLLMTEFSWRAIAILGAAVSGGLVCLAVGWVMRALARSKDTQAHASGDRIEPG